MTFNIIENHSLYFINGGLAIFFFLIMVFIKLRGKAEGKSPDSSEYKSFKAFKTTMIVIIVITVLLLVILFGPQILPALLSGLGS